MAVNLLWLITVNGWWEWICFYRVGGWIHSPFSRIWYDDGQPLRRIVSLNSLLFNEWLV